MKLKEKLFHVSEQLRNIEKDKTNKFHGYEYVSANKVFETVKPLLLQYNIIFQADMNKSEIVDGMTCVEMTYSFIDIDSDEVFSSCIPGWGSDKGDKGGYKAMTGALKSFFIQTFLISTDDDSAPTNEDAESDNERPVERKRLSTLPTQNTHPTVQMEVIKPKTAELLVDSNPNCWSWKIECEDNKFFNQFLFARSYKELDEMLEANTAFIKAGEKPILNENDVQMIKQVKKQKHLKEPTIEAWRMGQAGLRVIDQTLAEDTPDWLK